MKIAMSSGHGKYVAGASGYLEEHPEAVRVVNRTAEFLRAAGVGIETYEDTVSHTQNENLNRLVAWHNDSAFGGKGHDLDVSIHFNKSEGGNRSKPIGTECCYVTQRELAGEVATSIARATGLIDRGGKYRDGLFWLNNTIAPAILVECLFLNSQADVAIYNDPANFDALCQAIADAIGGQAVAPSPEPDAPLFEAAGRCSTFGGPADTGMSPTEGLAFIFEVSQAPQLFLPGSTAALGRNLDPDVFYFAARFDYAITPKAMLADPQFQGIVRAGGRELRAWPADWGPNSSTGRVLDLSPGLASALGLRTDDQCSVEYPAPAIEPIPPEPPAVAEVAIDVRATGPVVVRINGQQISLS